MAQQGATKEYVVRVPKCIRKKYNMMRFHTALDVDFKAWGPTKMERENNLREYKNADDELPKFGAGSEFGREEREEARRKRYGISVKKYKADDQPWLLTVDGKQGKKFKGIREGGVTDNASYYVFMQAKDGAFEAYPVEEWYNFQPIQRYKALSAEEAEKEFERRDKIMNYFSVMYQKKFKKDGEEGDEESGKKGTAAKSLLLSEMDDWMSDADSNDEDKDDDGDDSDERSSKKKKKKKGGKNKKKNQGGKSKKREDGGTDDEVDEESDEFNEGAEHDYISEDSSDSEQENDEVARKQLAGVDEGEALKKLLDSEEEDEEDKDKDKKEEANDEKNENDKEEKEKKKKKKKKKDKKTQESDNQSSDSSSDEDNNKRKPSENDPKKNVNALKRKIKESPLEMSAAKRAKHMGNNASSSAPVAAGSDSGVSEELIKRYLMRKPMTTTELLQKCKSKKTGLSSEQLVTAIAQTLKRINPVKQMIKGKMYLSVKNT